VVKVALQRCPELRNTGPVNENDGLFLRWFAINIDSNSTISLLKSHFFL